MKCKTVSCGFVAQNRVWWPGQTGDMCERCTARAQAVAKAMGFEVQVTPLHILMEAVQKALKVNDAVERLTGEKADLPGQER